MLFGVEKLIWGKKVEKSNWTLTSYCKIIDL